MSSQIRLEHVQQALASKDPSAVDLLIQIASATRSNDASAPLPEDAYTLEQYQNEIQRRSFYRQKADVQQQSRSEKIALLESQDADPVLAERLRSHEIILQIWKSDGAFERRCLMRILREIPLVYGPWKALKQIFKEAEATDDTEALAALSYRCEVGQHQSGHEVSRRTLKYLSRRAWRYLRNIGNALPACYADAAVDFLVEYDSNNADNGYSVSWLWHHVFAS